MTQVPIETLEITGFRGFRDLKIGPFGRVNLLVGTNNCGKTSLLEAVGVFAQPMEPIEWLQIARAREQRFPGLFSDTLETLRTFFYQFEDQADGPSQSGSFAILGSGAYCVMGMHATFSDILGDWPEDRQADPRFVGIPDRPRNGMILRFAREEFTPLGIPTKDESEITIWEDEPFRRSRSPAPLLVEYMTPYGHRSDPRQQRMFSRTVLGDRGDDLTRLISLIDPEVQGFEILNPTGRSPKLYIRHRTAGRLPLAVMGDGLRRAFLIAAAIPSVKGGVLLIDEFEAAIHASVQTRLFGWLVRAAKEFDVQVFMTTHSLEAISAILASPESRDADIVGFRIDRADDGAHSVRRFSTDALRCVVLEHGRDIRGG